MNTRTRRPSARWLAATVTTVLLGLSVTVPFLERSEGPDRVALEREHTDDLCGVGHDHTLCVLANTLRGKLPAPSPEPASGLAVFASIVSTPSAPSGAGAHLPTHSRDPPSLT